MKRLPAVGSTFAPVSAERREWLTEKAKPKKRKASPANELTSAIIGLIRDAGGYAVRINSQGQYNEALGRWTKGTTDKGTADIHGVLSGLHLSVEVKVGKDRMSDHQHETARRVEAAGGRYFVARDLEAFRRWFEALKREGGERV
jgi:hypothetical protein